LYSRTLQQVAIDAVWEPATRRMTVKVQFRGAGLPGTSDRGRQLVGPFWRNVDQSFLRN
jgi:hypothetical protein